MTVLHAISGIDVPTGGPGAALVGLGAYQARAGLKVLVLTAYAEGADLAPARALEREGVQVHTVGPVRWPLGRHPEIRRRLQALLPLCDVVHIHGLWEQTQHEAASLAWRRRVPYLFTPHGMLDPWSLRQGWMKKKAYMWLRLRKDLNRASAIHYTAQTECELAQPLGLAPQAIIEVNGVDLREFEALPARGEFRRAFPQIGERLMVLFLSRLHLKKGLDLLIPAMAKVTTAGAILVIAGADPYGYSEQVKQWVREQRIEDRVVFAGQLSAEQRIAAFVDADLFVLPSYQENFGIAVTEALAAGCPVVISDQVNIHREIQEAGVGGVVRRDAALLAAEIDRWLQDQDLRRKAGERARPFVQERYGWDQIARRWVRHYERIVAGSRAALQ